MERRRVVYSGRVQGVGFRATACETASGHVVSGWVRNEADGSVMLEVQGDVGEVERYLAELRRVMGRLIVREDSLQAEVVGGERGFEVRR